MDILEEFVDDNILSRANILKYIDDFSIYSFYIGEELELYTKYSSPLRLGDDDPSFSLYYSKYKPDKILFKDNSTGVYGDVFKFLIEYLQKPIKTVLLQINSDFGLGLNDEEMGDFKPYLIKSAPVRKEPTKIEITAHPVESQAYLEYWDNLGITKRTRDKFYTKDVSVIHYISDDHITVVAKILTISYEILGHYKIYQPFAERKYKFRNNYLDIYVEGALQLEFKADFCVITKSTKECMFMWEHFGWEAVAGKSETTPVNPFFMTHVLQKKYKQVFIWLDNDEAGKRSQAQYLEKYPWLIPVEFDNFITESDPTDLYLSSKVKGVQDVAIRYIKQLITTKIKTK
jgi:hypothetical protein